LIGLQLRQAAVRPGIVAWVRGAHRALPSGARAAARVGWDRAPVQLAWRPAISYAKTEGVSKDAWGSSWDKMPLPAVDSTARSAEPT
jgi:hypothetical protein